MFDVANKMLFCWAKDTVLLFVLISGLFTSIWEPNVLTDHSYYEYHKSIYIFFAVYQGDVGLPGMPGNPGLTGPKGSKGSYKHASVKIHSVMLYMLSYMESTH